MIIDFTVKNFRSFNEEQRLSFVASNYDKTLLENVIDPKLPGLDNVKLLKGVAIYGANAAGKTNVLFALKFLAHFVENSAKELDVGDPTGVEPFLLNETSVGEPTELALRFVAAGVRYHFVLVLNKTRVLYESLSAFPTGREQVWYERLWNDETSTYSWKPERPTDFKRDAKIVEFTRDNALFLSTAAKWNNKELEPVFLWFKARLSFMRLGSDFPPLSPGFTVRYLNENANAKNLITKFIQHADFGILSAQAKERDLRREDLPPQFPDAVVEEIIKNNKDYDIQLGHRGAGGKEYQIPWGEQSAGTQRYFALAGRWLKMLSDGYIVSFDEIEASLHPSMVTALLRLVFSDIHNKNGAQLLFTTHNPLLLDPTLLRRDQVWFADKDDEGATHLYPLTDYKPRKKESLVRGYLAGRYGAVPFIPSGLLGKGTDHGE